MNLKKYEKITCLQDIVEVLKLSKALEPLVKQAKKLAIEKYPEGSEKHGLLVTQVENLKEFKNDEDTIKVLKNLGIPHEFFIGVNTFEELTKNLSFDLKNKLRLELQKLVNDFAKKNKVKLIFESLKKPTEINKIVPDEHKKKLKSLCELNVSTRVQLKKED